MATRAIKRKRDEGPLRQFPSLPERAPSLIREDEPTPVRVIALIALLLVAMGGLGMVAPSLGLRYIISPAWGFFFLMVGVCGLLFHAFNEADLQFRRTYGALGLVLLCIAVLLRVMPFGGAFGALFLGFGVPCLGLALPLLLSFSRHETDPMWRTRVKALVGSVGFIMALAGFTIGSFDQTFLMREGMIYILFGGVYICSYIAMEGASTQQGYYAGLGLGAIGVVFFVTAFARSFLLKGTPYLVADGLLLMVAAGAFILLALCICVDWPFIVLLRRELSSLFVSPVAYLVILGFVLIGWFQFWQFVLNMVVSQREIPEPIVGNYIFSFATVIFLLFGVAVLTMRLLSEEQRTGTWEVLMTAPIGETSVVLSKFFAVLIFLMLATSTWGVNFIALRVMGEEPFDYRPLLSYTLTFACCGAGFLSIGVFFSSVTKNQIVAAALTFGVLVVLTVMTFVIQIVPEPWRSILRYTSYLNLWAESLEGVVSPRHLLIWISIAVFFLFLAVKVVESRKWK
jgi:ABC-2 type transport system permease protein